MTSHCDVTMTSVKRAVMLLCSVSADVKNTALCA